MANRAAGALLPLVFLLAIRHSLFALAKFLGTFGGALRCRGEPMRATGNNAPRYRVYFNNSSAHNEEGRPGWPRVLLRLPGWRAKTSAISPNRAPTAPSRRRIRA